MADHGIGGASQEAVSVDRTQSANHAGLHLVIVAVFLGLFPIVVLAWSAYGRYGETIAAAGRDLERTARLTAHWIDNSFGTILQLGDDLAFWIHPGGFVREEDLRHHARDDRLAATLRERMQTTVRIEDLFVVDAQGRMVADARRDQAVDRGAVDRLVANLRETPIERRMTVTPALPGGRTAVYVAIRLTDAAEVTTGAVVAGIDLSWFDALLSEIGWDSTARLSLLHTGGLDRVDVIAGATDALKPDGDSLSASVRVGSLDLMVVAAQSMRTAIASWRRDTGNALAILALWELTVALGYTLVRRWERSVRLARAARTVAMAAAREAAANARNAELRAREMAIDAIFDNDAVGFAEIALPEVRFVKVNRRFCTMSGRGADELLSGFGPVDIHHPDDAELLSLAVETLRREGSDARSIRFLHPDGTVVWAHLGVKVSAIDETGEPTRLITVAQDISEVKRATEEIATRETLLRLSLQFGHVGTFQRRRGESVLRLGDEIRTIFGLPDGVAEVTYEDLGRNIPKADRRRIREEIASAIANRVLEQAYTFRFVRPSDGVSRLLEARVRYDYDEEGRTGSNGVVIDVTETREAEAMLRLSLQVGRIGIFRHDFVTQTVECDATVRDLYGLPPGDQPIPAEVWFGCIVPEDRALLEAGLAASVEAGVLESSRDYRIRRLDGGDLRHFTARVHLGYDADGALITVNGVIIDMTDRYAAEAKIAHLAQHDVLTGLWNRGVLTERIDGAVTMARHGRGFALLMIDLDRFKFVNDTLGHPVGDELLRAVTGRLIDSVRDTDTLARLGGDEFAVLMPDLVDPREAATSVADRILARIAHPFVIGDHRIDVGSSIGIAVGPEDGVDADAIIKAADLALYRAKADGRGCRRFFEPGMGAAMNRRRIEEIDLRRGLADDEFDLAYQPLVDLTTGSAVGVEARPVWRHPTGGPLAAEAFVARAEEIGMLPEIGRRLLSRACTELRDWPGEPILLFPLSAAELFDRDFAATLAEALLTSGLPARRLELGIAESTLTATDRDASAIVEQIAALGVRLCISSIGSGKSVLDLVTRHHFDRVQVDAAELGDSRSTAVIAEVVAEFCRRVGSHCTAVGVDTEERRRAYERRGFGCAQGPLWGEPMTAADCRAAVAEGHLERRVAE